MLELLPESSAKPCSLSSQLGFLFSHVAWLSSVVMATESRVAESCVK